MLARLRLSAEARRCPGRGVGTGSRPGHLRPQGRAPQSRARPAILSVSVAAWSFLPCQAETVLDVSHSIAEGSRLETSRTGRPPHPLAAAGEKAFPFAGHDLANRFSSLAPLDQRRDRSERLQICDHGVSRMIHRRSAAPVEHDANNLAIC